MFLLVLLTSLSVFSSTIPVSSQVQIGKATAVTRSSSRGTCGLDSKVIQFTTSGSRGDLAFMKYELPEKFKGRTFNDINLLAFSWCRVSDMDWHNSILADGTYIQDWRYKSPFLRIFLADGSQLVWEAYYNHRRTPVEKLIDRWITEDALKGRWWVHRNELYTKKKALSFVPNGCKMGPTTVWSGEVKALSYEKIKKCFGHLGVTGFSIGAGNQWPLRFTGYALPMQFGFKQ